VGGFSTLESQNSTTQPQKRPTWASMHRSGRAKADHAHAEKKSTDDMGRQRRLGCPHPNAQTAQRTSIRLIILVRVIGRARLPVGLDGPLRVLHAILNKRGVVRHGAGRRDAARAAASPTRRRRVKAVARPRVDAPLTAAPAARCRCHSPRGRHSPGGGRATTAQAAPSTALLYRQRVGWASWSSHTVGAPDGRARRQTGNPHTPPTPDRRSAQRTPATSTSQSRHTRPGRVKVANGSHGPRDVEPDGRGGGNEEGCRGGPRPARARRGPEVTAGAVDQAPLHARGHRLRVARGKGEGRLWGDTARQLRVPSRGTLLGALDGPPREDPISSNRVPPTAVFVAMTGRVHCCAGAGGHCHAVGHKYNLVTSFYDKVHFFHTFWDRRRGALRGLLLSTATVTPAKRWSLRRRARAAPRGAWRGRGRHQRARPARPPRCPCSCSSPQCPRP